MTEQRITTKEAERIAWNIERGRFVPDDLAAAIRALAAERDALRRTVGRYRAQHHSECGCEGCDALGEERG